jgi:hypothetical protein
MRPSRQVFPVLFVSLTCALAWAQGCGSSGDGSVFHPDGGGSGDDGTAGDDGPFGGEGGICLGSHCGDGDGSGGDGTTGGCQGLGCMVNLSCPNGGHTTISGKVYDPRGQAGGGNPLYNILVYVPTDANLADLPAIPRGTDSCSACDASVAGVVAASLTDATGSFTLKDVPTGSNIPLVMQIGKWRRAITLPSTADCMDTPAPQGDTRLPQSMMDGAGANIPQMAVLTGGCDMLACFIRRIGLSDTEFGAPGSAARLHVYKGAGGGGGGGDSTGANLSAGGAGDCTGATCPLWSTKTALEQYDIDLLSCECGEHNETKTTAQKQNMHDWLDEGGKVFATHFHYTWFKNSPAADFQGIATWGNGNTDAPYTIDTTIPKAAEFVAWLNAVGVTTPNNTIDLTANDVKTGILKANPAEALRWIYTGGTEGDIYTTFDTPIGGNPPAADAGADAGVTYCGRSVYSDIHVSDSQTTTLLSMGVPTGCDMSMLTDQEKALEFLFFDLSSCVTNDNVPPPPPPAPQ